MTLTIVGDTRQTLYRFAGAKPEIMQNEIEQLFPDLQTFGLTVNFRSTQNIINFCMSLIRYNYAEKGGKYADRHFLSMIPRPDAPEGEPVGFHFFNDPDEEAEFIASEISQRIKDGRSPGDFFIASRTRAQTAFLEGPFNSAGIPFINITGMSFFDLAHIKDVISYLRVALDPNDAESFKRVYRKASADNVSTRGRNRGEYVPYRYLGTEFLSAIGGKWANIEEAVQSHNYDRWESGIEDLYHMFDLINDSLSKGPGEAIYTIIERCYRRWLAVDEGLSSDSTESSKSDELNTLVAIANKFKNPADFLAHIDRAVKAAQDAKSKDWKKYVVVSTIHRLKGLERNIVIAIGLSEGYMTLPNGLKMPAGLLPHTFSLINPPQTGAYPTSGKSPIEDERCIAFVAFSRAKEVLIITGPKFYQNKTFVPSRFIQEAGWIDPVPEMTQPGA